MSNSLGIYMGEHQPFDATAIIKAISSIDGVTDMQTGPAIEDDVFLCKYTFEGHWDYVSMPEGAIVIWAGNMRDGPIDFAMKLQAVWPQPLRVFDSGYSFDMCVRDYKSVEELNQAMEDGLVTTGEDDDE